MEDCSQGAQTEGLKKNNQLFITYRDFVSLSAIAHVLTDYLLNYPTLLFFKVLKLINSEFSQLMY